MPFPSNIRFVLALLLPTLAVFHSFVAAQTPALTQVDPSQVGLSAERLQRITKFLADEVKQGRIAGAVAMVARHGRVGYATVVGKSELSSEKQLETDALFRIASMTKAITSVAALSLVEDGVLALNDPISKHLPGFANLQVLEKIEGESVKTVAADRVPTVHDLLTHRSGYTYGWFGPEKLDALYAKHCIPELFVPVRETLKERVNRIADVPLKFQPGTAWDYGVSTDILGRIVEVTSGLRLDQFFHERILRPLKMNDTHFYVPPQKRDRLAGLYTLDDQRRLSRVTNTPVKAGFLKFSADYCIAEQERFFSGGGGLVSTAPDYLRFLQMLLQQGELDGHRILQPETVAQMTSNQIGSMTLPVPGHGDGFGLGVGVVTDRGASADEFSAGSYSWGGIFNSYYWVDPQEQLIGVLMTQVFPNDHLTLRSEFRRLAYEAIDDSGFERVYAYQPGKEFANPHFNGRQLRVNAPEASVHPRFAERSESQSSGLARILIQEDLREIRRADLEAEIWGGHPGTANKRVTINGRFTHSIPDGGTVGNNCTHQYPQFNLRPSDLVNGYNSLQFACDQGDTFWGHYIVDNVALRIGLNRNDGRLSDAGLADFDAQVDAEPMQTKSGNFGCRLWLNVPEKYVSSIAAVHFQGRYFGYDENGDGCRTDWHGMTKGGQPYGWLGTARNDATVTDAPSQGSNSRFAVHVDGSQWQAGPFEVRALIEFKPSDVENGRTRYWTAPLKNFQIPPRLGEQVSQYGSHDLPRPFWSRDDKLQECTIELDLDPEDVLSAELHVVAWTGGAGTIADYFTFNGRSLKVAEGHAHETVYSRIPIDPSWLRYGKNHITLRSDTEHHGIEIMLPGPTLMVRHRNGDTSVRLIESARDRSAGDIECYRIDTPQATYFLDKAGGGLSSMVDRDGNDWLGFHPRPGSGAAGEYRGFPNAVFKEAGSYFHARNDGTDACVSKVVESSPNRIVIDVDSENGLWAGRYVFTASACTFIMTKMPAGHAYWVLYEGTPGGQYDDSDWWITQDESTPQPLTTNHAGDLGGEWIAFGDTAASRMLVVSHLENDEFPDHFYQMQKKMTVFGFGRAGMKKFLRSVPQHFSVGFVESTAHEQAVEFVAQQRAQINDSTLVAPVDTVGDERPVEEKLRTLEQFALTHDGDAQRGRQLFFDDERTKCSICHAVGGRGGKVGPDLTKIGGKFDRSHLVDSLIFPSKQIGYGYETNTILTTDGKVIQGIMSPADDASVAIVDASNRRFEVAKDEIERTTVSKTSIMPTGIAEILSPQQFTDLVCFLETLGPAQGKPGAGVSGPMTLPDGFELQTVATGLSGATALEVSPDGRIFVCEQEGALRVIKDGVLLEEPFVKIPVEMNWERGLIGVTVAPDFPSDPHVYVVYVTDQPYTHHRVSRFRAEGDVAASGSEQILFRGDDQSKFGGHVPAGHQGGGIHFAPDGTLFIGIGEQTAKTPSQRMDALQGKILRIHADGTIPQDNPFLKETTGKYQAIWATGCRNPFTFAFNTAGEMFINDVGGEFEEINRGIAGANFGWPTVDHGPTSRADFHGPIHVYPQSSINGGDFADLSSSWPERFRNKYFFADFVQGWVRYIDPKQPEQAHEFLSGIRRPVDIRFANDGSLYVLLRNAWVVDDKFTGGTSSLLRVDYR